MSSKRDWNDVSDSENDSDNHQQQIQSTKEQQQSMGVPTLNKILSSPLPNKKNHNQSQNLLRLQNCPKQQVWLFVPLFYKDNIQDVDKSLKDDQNIKRVEKFFKGWNVLINHDTAKQYIVEGKKLGNLFIKFYFSNKNQQTDNNHKKSNKFRNNEYDQRKVKYVPKSPNVKVNPNSMKSPDSLRRIQSHQDQAKGSPKSPHYQNYKSKNDDNDSKEYRKKNYYNTNKDGTKRIQREDYKRIDRQDNRWVRRQDNKQIEKQNNRRVQSQDSDSDSLGKERANYDKGYKLRYTKKNDINSKTDPEYVPQSPKKKYIQKKQQQTKHQQISKQNNQQLKEYKPNQKKQQQKKQTDPQKIQPKQVGQKQELSATKNSNQQEPKNSPNEKKPQKKNKKNRMVKDDNNPYSMLNGL